MVDKIYVLGDKILNGGRRNGQDDNIGPVKTLVKMDVRDVSVARPLEEFALDPLIAHLVVLEAQHIQEMAPFLGGGLVIPPACYLSPTLGDRSLLFRFRYA